MMMMMMMMMMMTFDDEVGGRGGVSLRVLGAALVKTLVSQRHVAHDQRDDAELLLVVDVVAVVVGDVHLVLEPADRRRWEPDHLALKALGLAQRRAHLLHVCQSVPLNWTGGPRGAWTPTSLISTVEHSK